MRPPMAPTLRDPPGVWFALARGTEAQNKAEGASSEGGSEVSPNAQVAWPVL